MLLLVLRNDHKFPRKGSKAAAVVTATARTAGAIVERIRAVREVDLLVFEVARHGGDSEGQEKGMTAERWGRRMDWIDRKQGGGREANKGSNPEKVGELWLGAGWFQRHVMNLEISATVQVLLAASSDE